MGRIRIVFGLCWICVCSFNVLAGPVDPRPNILLILGDDLTFHDIGPYGNKQVHTPNLDRLAREGVCLDNMFTSTAMCAPTRQQLLTGLYPVRNGAYPNHSQVYPGTRSIPHYLNELGYRSAHLGKKHFAPLESFPFELLGGRDGDNGKGQDINLNVAEQFIQNTGDKPFFLMVASNQPHTPWNRGNESLYPASKIQIPEGFENTPLTRRNLSKYYAEITYLDSLVGVCLNILDKSGKKENTLVIFSSEQGSSMPFGKWTLYDRGLKTAFIARWPGKIEPHTRNTAMTQYVDVVPTLIELAGGDLAKINSGIPRTDGYAGLDGKSFLNVLTGKTQKFRDIVFGVHTTRGIINGSEQYAIRSARSKDFLYIRNLNYTEKFSNVLTGSDLISEWISNNPGGRGNYYSQRPVEELYDVKKDPYQLINLAQNSEFSRQKEKLRLELSTFMKLQGDKGKETEMRAKERLREGVEN